MSYNVIMIIFLEFFFLNSKLTCIVVRLTCVYKFKFSTWYTTRVVLVFFCILAASLLKLQHMATLWLSDLSDCLLTLIKNQSGS